MNLQLSRKKQERQRASLKPRSLLWRQVFIGLALAVTIGVAGIGIWYGTRIESLTLSSVEVAGGTTISHETIRALVTEELAGTFYRLVPKRFAWTYPQHRIEDRIARVPRVKNVRVERLSGTTLAIVFEEYVPYALWCSRLDEADCVFIDRAGYGFAEAPLLFGSALLRYVISDRSVAVGETPFTSDLIRRTEAFTSTVAEEFGFNVVAVEQTASTELAYHLAGGGTVRTSLDVSLEDTLKNLGTILHSSEFDHLQPGNFQYIDLRFGNKVFVNEETAPTPEGEGAASSSADATDS